MTETLTRAVLYSYNSDGSLDIQLLAPWDGKPRLDAFPLHIRMAVKAKHVLFATVEESHKIWTARTISDDVHAAVWDDILCTHATRMLAEDATRGDRFAREAGIIYGDANTPAWVRKLGKVLSRDEPEPDERER